MGNFTATSDNISVLNMVYDIIGLDDEIEDFSFLYPTTRIHVTGENSLNKSISLTNLSFNDVSGRNISNQVTKDDGVFCKNRIKHQGIVDEFTTNSESDSLTIDVDEDKENYDKPIVSVNSSRSVPSIKYESAPKVGFRKKIEQGNSCDQIIEGGKRDLEELDPWILELLRDVKIKLKIILSSEIPGLRILEKPEIFLDLKKLMLNDLPKEFYEENKSDNSEGDVCTIHDENDDFGIPLKLKNFIRIICEGSSKNLDDLICSVQRVLADSTADSPKIIMSNKSLRQILPIFLNQKYTSGFLEKPCCSRNHFNKSKASHWVWESPSIDFFPDSLRETAKLTREDRFTVIKKIRSLVKLKASIYSGDVKEINKMNDALNKLTKKLHDEKEKKARYEEKKRQIIEKKNAKEQERIAKEDEKKRKDDDKKKEEEEEKRRKIEVNFEKRSEEKKKTKDLKEVLGQQNVMINWLNKSRRNSQADVITVKHDLDINEHKSGSKYSLILSDSGVNYCGNDNNSNQIIDESGNSMKNTNGRDVVSTDDELIFISKHFTQEKSSEWIQIISEINQLARVNCHSTDECEKIDWLDNRSLFNEMSTEDLLNEFIEKFAIPHTRCLRKQIKFNLLNRKFYVEVPSVDVGNKNNIILKTDEEMDKELSMTHFSSNNFPIASYKRSVYFYDTEWKRPPRKLLINRIPTLVDNLHPFEEEPYIDYDLDSDDEWYELYDVEDLMNDDKKDDLTDEEEYYDMVENGNDSFENGNQDEYDDSSWIIPDYIVEEDNRRVNYSNLIAFNGDASNIHNNCSSLSLNSSDKAYMFNSSKHSRFHSVFPSWKFYFENEPKINFFTTLSEEIKLEVLKEWSSIYGCYDSFQSSTMIEKINSLSDSEKSSSGNRNELNSDDICRLAKFCHGEAKSFKKLVKDFQSKSPHLTKPSIERFFKANFKYKRTLDCKKFRWYVIDVTANKYNLSEELEQIMKAKVLSEAMTNDSMIDQFCDTDLEERSGNKFDQLDEGIDNRNTIDLDSALDPKIRNANNRSSYAQPPESIVEDNFNVDIPMDENIYKLNALPTLSIESYLDEDDEVEFSNDIFREQKRFRNQD